MHQLYTMLPYARVYIYFQVLTLTDGIHDLFRLRLRRWRKATRATNKYCWTLVTVNINWTFLIEVLKGKAKKLITKKKKTTTNYTRRSKPSDQCQCCTVARLDFVRIYTLLLDRPTVIMAAVAATTTTAVQSHNLKSKWSLVSNILCAAELFPLRFYWLVSKKEYVRPLLRRFETMSLPFSGSKSKSAGLVSAIRKQLFLLNLKPVKRVFVKYDPFTQNAVTTRLLYLTVLMY